MSYEEIQAHVARERATWKPRQLSPDEAERLDKWYAAKTAEVERNLPYVEQWERQEAKNLEQEKYAQRREEPASTHPRTTAAEKRVERRPHEVVAQQNAWDASHPLRGSLRTILGVGAAIALLGAATPFLRASVLLPVDGFSWDSTFALLLVGLLLALGAWLVAIGRPG